jgi:hypothetical protein
VETPHEAVEDLFGFSRNWACPAIRSNLPKCNRMMQPPMVAPMTIRLKNIPPFGWIGRTGRNLASHLKFRAEFRRFERMTEICGQRLPLKWDDRLPCLDDRTSSTSYDRHYVYHPAWAARVLAKTAPLCHVDLSSSLHFCTLVSAFIPVRFYDYRPANVKLSNLTSEAADLLALPFEDRSISSLSCMHVVEHVGLGRYGDPLDPQGDLKAIQELRRVLAPQGTLLFVVPVGRPRIQFNAHRIYGHRQILEYFPDLALEEFALIPDDSRDGALVVAPPLELADRQIYGCGCYWFRRTA